jgi:hypothetical protein
MRIFVLILVSETSRALEFGGRVAVDLMVSEARPSAKPRHRHERGI